MADRLPMKTNNPDGRRFFNRPVTTTHNGLEKLYGLIKTRIRLP